MSTEAPKAATPGDAELYERYLPVVRRIAMRTVRSLPSSITIDDVISAGWVGMVEAASRRTPEMEEEHFEAYASYRVRGAILDYLRALDPMSRKLRGASRKVTNTISALVGKLGRAPEQEEIAAEMGLSLDEYHDLLSQIGEAGYARLELSEVAEPVTTESSPEAITSRRELVDRVTEAVEGLPERLQLVMGLYYQEECSFRQIGEVLGVTESRVCQLHSEAIHLLRASVDGVPLPKKRRRSRRPRPVSTAT